MKEGLIAAQANKMAASNSNNNLKDLIKQMEPAIKAALPEVITPNRFTRIVLSAVSNNPKLGECTPGTFLGSMMQAAQLGLEPNTPTGQAYLIPFYNNKKKQMECQFQLGYKGLIDLAYRSGEISTIQAQTVYENDEFEYELGLDPVLKHKPAANDRGKPTFFYAVWKNKSGGFGFEVMSKEDIEQHAKKYSQSYGNGYSSPWTTNFEEMAKKTVLKKALKYAPMKTEFIKEINSDETTKTYVDNIPMLDVNDDEENVVEVDQETGEVKDA